MTHQTPTRAQAEAWLKAHGTYDKARDCWKITKGSKEARTVHNWACSDNIILCLAGLYRQDSDTIRAEMLCYHEETGQRYCTNCGNWHNENYNVCDECCKTLFNGVALCYDDHIADPDNMADVVQPERFADDGNAMEATIKPDLNVAIKHDSDKTRYSLLPWDEVFKAFDGNKDCLDLTKTAALQNIDFLLCGGDDVPWDAIAGFSMLAIMRENGESNRLKWAALRAVAEVFTSGAKTYGDDNWKHGLSETRRLDACRRHWAAYCCGEEMSEHGHHHLAHVLWYGLVGMWYDSQAKEAD